MEGLNSNETEIQKKSYVETINHLNEKYSGKSMFPAGQISNISYSRLGEVMSIYLTGDVPTNFQNAEIVIVHPDAEKSGWLNPGSVGFVLAGRGVDIAKIPMSKETIEFIRNIYQEYTGKECREFLNWENDINKFAVMGLYNDIVENNDK